MKLGKEAADFPVGCRITLPQADGARQSGEVVEHQTFPYAGADTLVLMVRMDHHGKIKRIPTAFYLNLERDDVAAPTGPPEVAVAPEDTSDEGYPA